MRERLAWIFFLFPLFLFSQTSIKGKVVDIDGKPLKGVSLVIGAENSEDLIAFDITDENGTYHIHLVSEESFLKLQIQSLGYASIKEVIPNVTTTKEYVLQAEMTSLDEVLIKAPPITQRGDTINYLVSSFAKEQDRSIAEVLNRLPGIEVQSNGQILYEGKPINKYYIDGMDLLEGKYDLANRNLPHKVVTNVQVLENHQPIKILDSLEFSDNAALNIELKDKYTFTGQLEGGIGTSPFLWEAQITPMLFTTKKQAILTYQTNNIGNNIAKQLKKLTLEDVMEALDNSFDKKDWLGIEPLTPPAFSDNRWLDNNTHVFSANLLHKLENDYELRYQASYLNDYQQQEGYTKTIFYTEQEAISLMEKKHNKLSYNSLDAQLTLHKNTAKNYLKNELELQSSWNSLVGDIVGGTEEITQLLQDKYYNISNKFKAVLPLGSQLLNLNSFINFLQAPEKLEVHPGQFSNILNENIAYDKMLQEVQLSSFYTNNHVGLTKRVGAFSLSPKLGFQWEKQNLESHLSASDNKLNSDFFNHLNWERTKSYFHLKSQFRKAKWRIELNTPIYLHTYRIVDQQFDMGQDFNRITWEPRLLLTKDIHAHWKLRGALGVQHNFGAVDQVHYAYILQNYRSLQRKQAPLLEAKARNISGGINYRNPIRSLFGGMNYTYLNVDKNLLYDTAILSNGAVEINAILKNNTEISHKFSGRLSKYLSAWRTTITLVMDHTFKKNKSLINHNLSEIKTHNSSYTSQLDVALTSWLNAEYYGIYTHSNNSIQNQANQYTKQQRHKLHLNFELSKSNHLRMETEYITNVFSNTKQQHILSDIVYRHSLKEKNLDLELYFTNIFNTTHYRKYLLTDFSSIETNYILRPRQVGFKIKMAL